MGFSPPKSLSKGVGDRARGCQQAGVSCASETDTFEAELVKSNTESGSVLLHVLIREAGDSWSFLLRCSHLRSLSPQTWVNIFSHVGMSLTPRVPSTDCAQFWCPPAPPPAHDFRPYRGGQGGSGWASARRGGEGREEPRADATHGATNPAGLQRTKETGGVTSAESQVES